MFTEDPWDKFVRRSAHDIMAGQLTTMHLREAIKDPRIRLQAQQSDFRQLVVKICEQTAPASTRGTALMQEIDAADKRLRKLLQASRPRSSDSPPPQHRFSGLVQPSFA
jgi:hypothetical protein